LFSICSRAEASCWQWEQQRDALKMMQEFSDEGMTSIVVTHELGFARRAANEVVFMDAGLVAHRAPVGEFFNGSAPDRVARFLSRMHA
jgi:polar amino acid transport system ATP-binding protein